MLSKADSIMGLGSFRVRLVAALLILLVVWQSTRVWLLSLGDPRGDSNEVNENGAIQADGVQSSVRLQNVLISVYYEALCPDSRNFVAKQLERTFQTLKGHVTVEMIPYGKATTTETDHHYEFVCQHGPTECEANMIHACAIDIIKDPTLQLEFLTCMIQNNLNPQNITKTCAETWHVDAESILNCYRNPRGKELLAMYGKMTHALRPQIVFIPTITLDKSSDNQPEILKNLLKQVCLRFKVPPKGCTV